MKRKTKKAIFWMVPGLVLSLLALLIVFRGLTGEVLVTDPEGISRSTEALMQSVQQGDWEQLQQLTADHPRLQPQTGAEGTGEALIWKAYQESLRWEYDSTYEVQGAQVIRKVTVTCLDIAAFTRNLTVTLTEAREEDALVTTIWEALAGELPTLQRTIDLHFVRREGQWQLVTNQALLALLSGFTAK